MLERQQHIRSSDRRPWLHTSMRPMTRGEIRSLLKGLAFLSPWLIGFGAFMFLPIVLSMYYSLCDYNLLQSPAFIGAENYRALIHDGIFWKSLRVTLLYAAISLPAGLVVSLGVAVLLNVSVRGQAIFRTIVFVPSLVPTIAAAMIWKWMFNQRLGLINRCWGRCWNCCTNPARRGWISRRG